MEISKFKFGKKKDQKFSRSVFQATNFISSLFSQYKAVGLVEMRFLNEEKRPFSQFYTRTEILRENKVRKILRLNEQGYNVYIGVNPRPTSKEKKQDDIKDIVCLWLDIDGKNFEGGKEQALNQIMKFPIYPNIVVDSGNGYHIYWMLKDPIIDRTEDERIRIKQSLGGLAKVLGADKQAINLDRVMRLPGTLNLKEPNEPKKCQYLSFMLHTLYSLDGFDHYRDSQYFELEKDSKFNFEFGSKELIVSNNIPEEAIRLVKNLEVSEKFKRMIIAGDLQKGIGFDKTRSGRDQAIITALVAADYNYPTLKSIFLNSYLGCSNRIRGKGEVALQYDVKKAVNILSADSRVTSPQANDILNIKSTNLKPEEQLRRISLFIIKDLFTVKGCAGKAYKDEGRKIFYYFDLNEKLLMDIKGTDFKNFIKNRYQLPKKDFDEVISSIEAHIWAKGQLIEAHDFAYFDNETKILYISNNENEIFRLDGEHIDLIDNGTDGVIFEFKPEYTPIKVDVNNLRGINYFEGGLNWERFVNNNSYIHSYLISRANFAVEEKHDLLASDQEYL